MSREKVAKEQLDKAYERLLANKEAVSEFFNTLFKDSAEAAKYFEIYGNAKYAATYKGGIKKLVEEYNKARANKKVFSADEFISDKKDLRKFNKKVGIGGAGANFFADLAAKQNLGRAATGLVVDGLLIMASESNPVFLVLDIANLLDKMTLNSGAFDLRAKAQKLYDKITNTSADLPDMDALRNGILKITMPNGDIYERVLEDTGKPHVLSGGKKSDVLFGGSGNDILTGQGGGDLLIGGAGFDNYFVNAGDIIDDSDKQGRIFDGYSRKQYTGGTYDKDRGCYVGDGDGWYKMEGDDLIINGNIRVKHFNKQNNDLGITLLEADEIAVSLEGKSSVAEGDGGKHYEEYGVKLNRQLQKGEWLILKTVDPSGKERYIFQGDMSCESAKPYYEKLFFKQSYGAYLSWSGNDKSNEDIKTMVGVSVYAHSDNIKVKSITPKEVTIKDDDRDPNEDLPETYDPIVIDFNKNGVTSTRLDNTVYFDHDNNGFAEATAWVEKDDGLLALDKNNNGKIDNGNELFGNHTISNTAYGYTDKKATNGYEALKAYDLNGDNVIDEKDEIFNKLKIWKDKNSNGITDEGELSSLADNNIKSIDLNYKEIAINENSNTVKQSSKVTLKDGSTLDANDVWMKVNLNKTEEIIDQSKLPPEVQALPQVMASGNLSSLRVAAGKNEKLATIINLYLMLSPEDRKKHIDELIYEWAGVGDMDPNSRTTSIDSRIVNVYEKLTGKPFTWHGSSNDANIGISANIIKERFDTFKRYVYSTIELQTTYSDMDLNLDLMNLGEDGKLSYKFDALNSKLMQLYKDEKYNEIVKLIDTVRGASAYKPIFQENLKTNLLNFCGNDDKLLSICLNTYISGTADDDIIDGNSENNFVAGGKGNDSLNGGAGDDTYIFARGDGNDTIYDAMGNDKIQFKEGITPSDISFKRELDKLIISIKNNNGINSDSITIQNFFSVNPEIGNNTVRTITFADGSVYDLNKILELAPLSPTDKDDKLYLTDGNDTFDAGLGNDEIWGGNGDDVINGGEGDDTLYGNDGNDTLIGGKGDDTLNGGKGDDTYIFSKGDGTNTIIDNSGNDTIKFNDFSASDISLRREFRDVIITSKVSNDKITIKDFYDNNGNVAYSTKKIIFKDDSVWDYQTIINNSSIKATEEDDKFYLGGKDDIFDALGGDDEIHGQYGNDTLKGGSGNDKLYGDDGNDILNGGDGNDILDGGYGDDTLAGGAGNDTLNGGYGDDTYVFNKGDGMDIVEDRNGIDTIKFGEGIQKEDLIVSRNINKNAYGSLNYTRDIVIKFKHNETDSITLKNVIAGSETNASASIENFRFANGESLSFEDIKRLSQIGSDKNDIITAYYDSKNNTLIGGGGNDELYGKHGNDILIGGKDDDILNGSTGDDTYIFNKGDGKDIIEDNGGADTIKFGEGISKEDIIVKRVARINSYTKREEYSDISISFKNSPNDSITIQNVIDDNKIKASNIIENFEFANGEKLNFEDIKKLSLFGTDDSENIIGYADINNIIKGEGGDDKLYGQGMDDTIYGGDGNDLIESDKGNDTLIGGRGNDILNGGMGDDTYVFNKGDGNDIIEDNGGADTLKFGEGIRKEDLLISRDANKENIVIKFKNNTADSITLKNVIYENKTRINGAIENFEFANGDKLSFKDIKELPMVGTDSGEAVKGFDDANNTLVGGDGNDKLYGGNGNDTLMGGDGEDELHGGKGDNTLIGGKGNDIIEGGNGNDTYIFNKGDGADTIKENGNMSDVLKFGKGISKEDLIVTRGSYYGDITIKFKNNDTDSIILKDAIVRGSAVNGGNIDYFEFENGDKLELDDIKRLSLLGTDQNDKLSAYHDMDNNIIKGFGGDDVIEGAGTDVLGRGLKDTIYGGEGNDSISGYGGDDVLYGEEGNDSIDGGDGNDIIVGGKGDDILDGGDGDDTYVFNIGDGADIIEESRGGMDIIKFGEGINKEDIIISKSKREEGDREPTCLTIKFKNNDKDSITLQSVIRDNKPSPYYAGAKALQFANGDKLSFEDIIALSLVGTDKNETIRGYSDANNTIVGNGGNDELYGDRGDDTLIGGTGDDILNGGAGNDTFVFNKGDGNDTIVDDYIKYSNDKDSDTLKFGEGISKEDLIAKRVRNDYPNDNYRNYRDIVISLKNSTGDSITLRNATDQNKTDENNAVKTFKFANGEELGIEEIKRLSLIGTDADDDTLYGYNDMDNIIKGGDGNDTLTGGGGVENILEGGRGNDILKGGYRSYGEEIRGKNTFVFSKGDGKDTITSINNGDLIKFKDLNKEDVKFELDLVNKTLLISSTVSNDTVLVEGYSATSEEYDHINQRNIVNDINIEFKDGKILGSDFINKQVKPIGDANTMVGGSENNTFEYEGGLKSIVDIGGYDKVIFKKPGNKIYYSSDGTNLKISTAPIDEDNKDVLEVKGFFNDKNNIVEEFQINSYWNIKAADIYRAFGKTYIGDEKPAQPNDPGKPDTPSDNTIIGGSGNDTFPYEGGLKSIKDSGGYDKVIFKKEGNHVYYQMFGEDLKISTAPINEDNKDVLEVKGFFGNKNNIVEEFQINSYWNIKAQDIYKAFGKTYIGDAKPTALVMDANSAMNSKAQISPLSKSSGDSSNSKSGWDMVLGSGDKNELKAIVSKFYNDADPSTSKHNSALNPSGVANLNTISGISQKDALKDNAFLSENTVNKIIEQLNIYADNSEALEFNQKDIRKDDMQVYMS